VTSLAEIHDYYVDATEMYARYSAGTGGWHVGLWDAGVATHGQSIFATNRRLLAGLAIDANTHILDVGFGSGSLAMWAAHKFGCRVTGITVVPLHVAMAQLSAAMAGVGHLCDFQHMDMTTMTFPDATFDIVTNQETFCYVEDKRRYLGDVRRVLRPGGAWRAVDCARSERKPSVRAERRHRRTCDGWHTFPYARPSDVERLMDDAALRREPTEDLTPLTLRCVREWLQPGIAGSPSARRRERARDPRRAAAMTAHFDGSRACARALIDGEFAYVRYAATRG
jgi:cyclopropane fatty-acyl-phospholipid synthase-like methyltransferase